MARCDEPCSHCLPAQSQRQALHVLLHIVGCRQCARHRSSALDGGPHLGRDMPSSRDSPRSALRHNFDPASPWRRWRRRFSRPCHQGSKRQMLTSICAADSGSSRRRAAPAALEAALAAAASGLLNACSTSGPRAALCAPFVVSVCACTCTGNSLSERLGMEAKQAAKLAGLWAGPSSKVHAGRARCVASWRIRRGAADARQAGSHNPPGGGGDPAANCLRDSPSGNPRDF